MLKYKIESTVVNTELVIRLVVVEEGLDDMEALSEIVRKSHNHMKWIEKGTELATTYRNQDQSSHVDQHQHTDTYEET